ncbi:MAG TPA: DUF3592 domain-containing protein, partial [Chitinophagaceae bacterium]|nr:DUF3592 domain-containing protein [Chitinophagaceae bacterium]
MRLSKAKFFLLLFVIISAPFLVYKINWLLHSQKTIGTMSFVGKSQTGQIGHAYSVVWFVAGNDTVWFNGNDNILFKPGEPVPVRYLKNDPSEARLDVFPSIWGDTLVYGGGPLLVLVALFLHRGIIPHRSKIKLSAKRPF